MLSDMHVQGPQLKVLVTCVGDSPAKPGNALPLRYSQSPRGSLHCMLLVHCSYHHISCPWVVMPSDVPVTMREQQ